MSGGTFMNIYCSPRALALWLIAITLTTAQGQSTKPANTSTSSTPAMSTKMECGLPGQKPCGMLEGKVVVGNCTGCVPKSWHPEWTLSKRKWTWLAYPDKEQYLKTHNIKPTYKIKH
jgi:hypothetical protein